MKKIQILTALMFMTCLSILANIHMNAQAGLFKDTVGFGDLAQLSQENLEVLKETEWQVFLMQVELARTEELRKAAKESQDQARTERAEAVLESAEEKLKMVELLVNWKNKEVKARKAGVKKAKLRFQVAEAKRDLARVSQLVSEKTPSAHKYSLSDYRKRVQKKQRDLQEAVDNEERQIWEEKKSKEKYESILKPDVGKE